MKDPAPFPMFRKRPLGQKVVTRLPGPIFPTRKPAPLSHEAHLSPDFLPEGAPGVLSRRHQVVRTVDIEQEVEATWRDILD